MMTIKQLEQLASRKGLNVAKTVGKTVGKTIILHSSPNGYAVLKNSIFKGSINECERYLNEEI